MVTYTIELLANELTEEIRHILMNNEYVTGIYFESHPNKEHSSILVDIELQEEQDDDILYEQVTEDIERIYYSLNEVLDYYDSLYE